MKKMLLVVLAIMGINTSYPMEDPSNQSEEISFSDALSMFNDIAQCPEGELDELLQQCDMDTETQTSSNKNNKPRNALKNFVRRGLNNRGLHNISSRVFSSDNATAFTALARKAPNAAQEAALLIKAASSSQNNSKSRQEALLQLYNTMESARLSRFPQIRLAQNQFVKPSDERNIEHCDAWIKNLKYFQEMQEPRKVIVKFLKQTASFPDHIQLLSERISLMDHTLHSLKKKRKSTETLTDQDRLFCELQDQELNEIFKLITKILELRDKRSGGHLILTEQNQLNNKCYMLTLVLNCDQLPQSITDYLATYEELQKLGQTLRIITQKPKNNLTDEDKSFYNKNIKHLAQKKMSIQLLFEGIKQMFLLNQSIKQNDIEKTLLKQKLNSQAASENDTLNMQQIERLETEKRDRESWLQYINRLVKEGSKIDLSFTNKINLIINQEPIARALKKRIEKKNNDCQLINHESEKAKMMQEISKIQSVYNNVLLEIDELTKALNKYININTSTTAS
jgi:hypothetical protein